MGLIGIIIGGKTYESCNESYIFTRNLRMIRCGLNILYSYKISFNEENYLDIH